MGSVDLRRLKGIVNAYPVKGSGDKQQGELTSIEAEWLKNFTFIAIDDSGRSVPLTTGRLRVLADNPDQAQWLMGSSDFRGELKKLATRDVEAVVDRTISGSAVYPGCGWDDSTIMDVLHMFPKLTDVYLVDHGYIANHIIGGNPQFSGFVKDMGYTASDSVLTGKLGSGGEILVPGEREGRMVRFHFMSEDVYNMAQDLVPGKAAVTIVKYPGESGELADDPRFYGMLREITRESGYLLVRHARKPSRDIRGIKFIMETDMTNPGSGLFVSGDDWAVYQRGRP